MLNTHNNRFLLAFVKVLENIQLPQTQFPFFTTDKNGIYKIYYEDQFRDNIFNQVATYKQLKKCKYYSNTFLVKNNEQFQKLEAPDGRYYIKPTHGFMSTNISICDIVANKKIFLFKNNLEFPCICQKEIIPKLKNGFKSEYRVYVLFVHLNGELKTYIYPICNIRTADAEYGDSLEALTVGQSKKANISKVPKHFLQCIKDSISYLQLPTNFNIFLVGYDIIEDIKEKPMIIEINSVPNFFHKSLYKKFQTQLIQDIIQMCIHHFKTKNISIKNFIPI